MTAAKNKKMDRQIKGIFIPIEIWQDNTLTWKEKVLLMEIDSFTSKDLDCYFSNEYIATLLDVRTTTASKIVASLIRKGYIRQTRFDGRKRYLQTCIEIQSRVAQKCKADLDESARQTRTEMQHNNISNKQTNKEGSKSPRFDFRKALLDLGVTPGTADAFMEVRKAKKAVNTEIAFNGLRSQIEKSGLPPEACIIICVEQSWKGFKASWVNNLNTPLSSTPTNRRTTKALD